MTNIAQRLAVLEAEAQARGINIDGHLGAIERRIAAVEARLHDRSEYLGAEA